MSSAKKKKEEAAQFWAFVEKTSEEVKTWPTWKQEIFPEDALDLAPVAAMGEVPNPKRRKRIATK